MRGVQPIRGGVMHGYNDPQNQGGGMSAAGGIEEVVNVPGNLSDFASDPKFQQILLKVKLQTSINFVDLQRDKGTNKVLAIVINAPTSETAGNARRLVETHFKNQIKIMSAEAKLAKTQTELFSAQGEVASGMMVDFFVPISVIGLVIGKSGARIKQIEKDTGVSSINVDGHTGKIMVVGPDAASVQSARELLELQEDVLPLNSSQAEWLSNDRFNGSLTDIRADNNLSSARVDRDNTQLSVVGTVPAIRSLRAMLPVQLEYIDKAIEIESTERHAREQLRDFKREHGMRGMGDDRRGYQGRGGVRAGSNSNSSGYGAGRPNQNPNPKPPAPPSTSTGASTGKGSAKGKKGGEAAVTMTVTGLPPKAPEETKAKAKQTKTPAPAAAPKKEEPAAKKGKAKKGDSKKGDEVDQLTAKVAAVKVEDAPPAAKAKKGAAAKKGKDEEKVAKDKKDDGKAQAANDKTPAPEGGTGPEDSKRRRGNNKKDKKEGTAVTPTPAAAAATATATATATTAEKDKKDKEGVESKEGKGKKSKAKAKKEDAPKEVAAPAAGPAAEGAKEEGKPKPKPKKAANKKTDKQEKSTDPTPESTTKALATGGEAKEKKDSKGRADKKEKDSTAKQAEKTDGGVLDIAPLGKREKKDRGANKADKAEKASAEKASNPEVSAEA